MQELASQLTVCAAFLEQYGVHPDWPSMLLALATRLRDGDISAAAELRTQFGGMGSFNDILIHPHNGHRIDEKDVDIVNSRLGEMRHQLFESCIALVRGRTA